MVKYRCPSVSTSSSYESLPTSLSSSISSASNSTVYVGAPRPRVVKAQHKKASSSGASRNPVKISAGEKVKEAKKKALKKKDDRKELIPHMPQFCDVYVGNVHSDLKESHLEELFSRCGVIDNVVISVASGVAVPTADIPPPYKVCGIRFGKRYEGTHYACVTFKDPVGACHALEMDGTELGGRPLIVSVSVGEMPEYINALQDIIEPPVDTRSPFEKAVSYVKRLTIEKTEAVIEVETPTKGSSLVRTYAHEDLSRLVTTGVMPQISAAVKGGMRRARV